MGRWNQIRYALTGSVAAALLAACGGSQSVNPVLHANGAGEPGTHHKRFDYTGTEQWFTVPRNVTKVTIIAIGARGGGFRPNRALPGRTRAIVSVMPGEKLAVFVGGQGSNTTKTRGSKPNDGGFNGGGGGGDGGGTGLGWGGGGASDVRQGGHSLQDRIVIAGGGGGLESSGGSGYGGLGGKGGGHHGGAGVSGGQCACNGGGGGGGTQNGGGAGGVGGYASSGRGSSGSSGSLGAGGAGGAGGGSPAGSGGGGGGGGYYGGGGGGGGSAYEINAGGGGGGSGYVEPGAYAGRTWEGWNARNGDRNGSVTFYWSPN